LGLIVHADSMLDTHSPPKLRSFRLQPHGNACVSSPIFLKAKVPVPVSLWAADARVVSMKASSLNQPSLQTSITAQSFPKKKFSGQSCPLFPIRTRTKQSKSPMPPNTASEEPSGRQIRNAAQR